MSARLAPARAIAAAAILLVPAAAAAQRWVPQRSGTTAEIRALAAAGERVAWAGGRNGAFTRTVDGGASWRADTVPGASGLFFVGAHAASAATAWLLGTSFVDTVPLARIYRTDDGGATWRMQWESTTPGIFLDGLAFWDARRGIAFGDPLDGAFVVLLTDDGGQSWERVPAERLPPPLPGEAAFAASGTAITVHGTSHVWIATGGGPRARVLRSADRGRSWSVAETPIAGGASAGLFTIAFTDSANGVALGGDYQRPRAAADDVIATRDGGRTWMLVGQARPHGVRYGAAFAPPRAPGGRPTLVAVGPSGSGWSADGGRSWSVVDTVGWNTVRFAGGAGWAAGTDGRIGRWEAAAPGTPVRKSQPPRPAPRGATGTSRSSRAATTGGGR